MYFNRSFFRGIFYSNEITIAKKICFKLCILYGFYFLINRKFSKIHVYYSREKLNENAYFENKLQIYGFFLIG